MRAWQYTTTEGGIEKNLHINADAPVPTPKPKQNLVKVIAMALNPADYKNAESSLLEQIHHSKLASLSLASLASGFLIHLGLSANILLQIVTPYLLSQTGSIPSMLLV
jgi:hypothetical protein